VHSAGIPLLLGGFFAPTFVGSAVQPTVPTTTVIQYNNAPANTVVVQPPTFAESMASQNKGKLVDQQYTRVNFYNKDTTGLTLEGAVVTEVSRGSDADDGGVEEGFVVVALNDEPVSPGRLFDNMMKASSPYKVDFVYIPDGWEARWDSGQEKFYFANHGLKVTQWKPPQISVQQQKDIEKEKMPQNINQAIQENFGRGQAGVFTINTYLNLQPRNTPLAKEDPEVGDADDEKGALVISLNEDTRVSDFIELVEDAYEDYSPANQTWLIDFTSAYGPNGKLSDAATLSNALQGQGQENVKVQVVGHQIPRGQAGNAAGCCTIL